MDTDSRLGYAIDYLSYLLSDRFDNLSDPKKVRDRVENVCSAIEDMLMIKLK